MRPATVGSCPRGLRRRTVPEEEWAGKKNGELLDLDSASFDVSVTIDQNLRYQQNLRDAAIAIVVLESRKNRYDDLLSIVPRLIEVLQGDVPGGGVFRVGR